MSRSPVISHLLVVPGLSAPSNFSEASVSPTYQSISVGLVIDDERVFWVECQLAANDEPLTILNQKVASLLEGRSLADYRGVMEELDRLTETAIINRQIAQSSPDDQPMSPSRRGLLTGNLSAANTKPTLISEQITVERPIPPAIRFYVSQALLSAQAAMHGITVTELITADFNLPLLPSIVPIHLDIVGKAPTPDTAVLSRPIQSLGYSITGNNPQAQLGANGERLQHFIRQLTGLIGQTAESDYRPAIHLSVDGGLGQLFDDDAGRILGALYGLEQAAKPYPLRISDPVVSDDSNKQIGIMSQLVDYIRMRGMKIRLVASRSVRSLTNVQRYSHAGAAHLLELSLLRLGTVQQGIRAIQICQDAEIAVLLRDDGKAQPFISHVALAAQPALIGISWDSHGRENLDLIYGEMARTAAWIDRN